MGLTILAVYLAALALIVAECVVPGAVLGILGTTTLLASMGMTLAYYPDSALLLIPGQIVGTMFSIALGMYIMTHTRVGRIMVLGAQQNPEEGWTAPGVDTALTGAMGIAHTALRPAGAIEVDGQRIDAVSNGTFIERGKPVRIVQIDGNRVVVEETGAA